MNGRLPRLAKIAGGIFFAMVFLFAVSVPTSNICWQGGFLQVEYRLAFVGGDGQPLPGVVLRVEDRNGAPAFYYPVTDYTPDWAPQTNRDGVIVFHHVGSSVPEFGGSCRTIGGLLRLGTCEAPEYHCVFQKDGATAYQVEFRILQRTCASLEHWETLQKVRRRWKWADRSGGRPAEMPWHVRGEGDPDEEDVEFRVADRQITIP